MMGVDFIFPIHAGRHYDFRTGVRIGKKDHIVTLNKQMLCAPYFDIVQTILHKIRVELHEKSITHRYPHVRGDYQE